MRVLSHSRAPSLDMSPATFLLVVYGYLSFVLCFVYSLLLRDLGFISRAFLLYFCENHTLIFAFFLDAFLP